MNILFYTHGKVYATRGGTERTTVSMASALARLYGCRCFSLYEVEEVVEKEDSPSLRGMIRKVHHLVTVID